MSIQLSSPMQSVIDTPALSRIRRNHGLEHATLHVLSQRRPRQALAGHSDLNGFWIVGDLSTEEVGDAVVEALQRLRNGESHLAVHAHCGTNLVTSGILAGLAGALAMAGAGRRWGDKLERLPLAVTLATAALMVAQPLGMRIQELITTSSNPQMLRVVEVRQTRQGRFKAHRVITEG